VAISCTFRALYFAVPDLKKDNPLQYDRDRIQEKLESIAEAKVRGHIMCEMKADHNYT